MKFSIKDLFSKCFLRIWSDLLKKSLKESFIFCAVYWIRYCYDALKFKFEIVEDFNLSMYSINQLYSIIRTYLYHFLILHYQKKPNLSLSILHLRQDVRVNTVNFFKKCLSCTMEVGAVKEERSGCFDLLTTTTNGF